MFSPAKTLYPSGLSPCLTTAAARRPPASGSALLACRLQTIWHDRRANPTAATALFSTSRQVKAKNQIFAEIRYPETLNNYILLSSSSRTPLLTLWKTAWCPTCRAVEPLLRDIVGSGVGEEEGGVGYAPVVYDSPDVMAEGLGAAYMINSVPTLLSFDAGEAQVLTKVADGGRLADRAFLEEWVRKEARRRGNRGGGGGGGGVPLFGGLFGSK